MMDYSIDLLPSFDFGLYDADGLLLATFPTQSQAERAARNAFGFAAPAPLDPVVYYGDGTLDTMSNLVSVSHSEAHS